MICENQNGGQAACLLTAAFASTGTGSELIRIKIVAPGGAGDASSPTTAGLPPSDRVSPHFYERRTLCNACGGGGRLDSGYGCEHNAGRWKDRIALIHTCWAGGCSIGVVSDFANTCLLAMPDRPRRPAQTVSVSWC